MKYRCRVCSGGKQDSLGGGRVRRELLDSCATRVGGLGAVMFEREFGGNRGERAARRGGGGGGLQCCMGKMT